MCDAGLGSLIGWGNNGEAGGYNTSIGASRFGTWGFLIAGALFFPIAILAWPKLDISVAETRRVSGK